MPNEAMALIFEMFCLFRFTLAAKHTSKWYKMIREIQGLGQIVASLNI